jgi:hypothetical protein
MIKSLLLRTAVVLMAASAVAGIAAAGGPTVDRGAQKAGTKLIASGVLKKAVFNSATNQVSNNTATFVDVFSTALLLSGSGTQCILALYSGETALTGTPEGQISGLYRTLIDGVVAEPGQTFVSPDDNGVGRFETVAYNAWRCGLAAGTHVVKVQIAGGSGVTMFARTRALVIEFKK